MKSQKALRKRLLHELYHRARGDINKTVGLDELDETLAEAAKETSPKRPTESTEELVRRVADQLAQKGLLTIDHNPHHHSAIVKITVLGIEEGEKMERPLLERWPSEHPILYGACISILTAIVTAIAVKLLERLF